MSLVMADKYRFIGPVYDFLSALYSGQSIHQCKIAMLDPAHLKAGDKVLFAGVGHGKDAIYAAQQGADVTVVDLSETMLNKFQQALDEHNQSTGEALVIRKVHADIFNFDEFEMFDMVVANFFLNVFSEQMMAQVMEHLIKLTKGGGKFVVGDFLYPTGNWFSRTLQKTYWYVAVTLFWLMAKNAMHSIYNYPAHMERCGLTVTDKKRFKLLSKDAYWSVLGQKQA